MTTSTSSSTEPSFSAVPHNGPVHRRSCTNPCFLAFFVLFLVGWGGVFYFGMWSSFSFIPNRTQVCCARQRLHDFLRSWRTFISTASNESIALIEFRSSFYFEHSRQVRRSWTDHLPERLWRTHLWTQWSFVSDDDFAPLKYTVTRSRKFSAC